ncbi:hypothetical protein Y032_0003g1481 [Ancylostoma ceylanicum]|uniref:Uncharacterized protein n=1 Tax=Ancylostoma ceylanicum TaxID=53326 RepID=A0A016VZQ5_9BILA|nr:hypothetical protein Y032_0003g1481 [Ancylostoma ceylanicum]
MCWRCETTPSHYPSLASSNLNKCRALMLLIDRWVMWRGGLTTPAHTVDPFCRPRPAAHAGDSDARPTAS